MGLEGLAGDWWENHPRLGPGQGSWLWHAQKRSGCPPFLTPAFEFRTQGATSTFSLMEQLAPTVGKTVAGLGLLLVGGRFVLRRVFEVRLLMAWRRRRRRSFLPHPTPSLLLAPPRPSSLFPLAHTFLIHKPQMVAQSRNTEAFLALSLLTVAGASFTTSSLGLSDSMGAFIAGVLLAETNYKTQVEADIKPFRGLLLGLFFCTTGGSIDVHVSVR